jgi:alcohol dehydrogenase class IV
MRFDFCLPERIVFGSGSTAQAGGEAKRLGGRRVLIVTSRGMTQRQALVKAMDSLQKQGLACDVFSAVEPEPSLENATNCTALVRDRDCDLILGVGGGSVMDVAKKAAAEAGIPRIMMPTTAGSGSEVTHESVLKVKGKKQAFVDTSLTPDVAIVDPDISSTMPPHLTACCGADALAHAIECYESRNSNPLVQALALRSYELLRDNLVAAIENLSEARVNMALGSLMAGMAFGNSGTALGHALSYALSNRGVPHGQAVAMALPGVLEFNGTDPSFATTLKQIISPTGPRWNPDWDIAEMTAEVMADHRHLANNPREVTDDDVRYMFEQIATDFPTRPRS